MRNYGDIVICDSCGSDHETYGGVLSIGGNATCGTCCEDRDYYNEENKKYVAEYFDKNKTFKQNVLDYRRRVYGTSNLIVQMRSIDISSLK